MNTKGTPRRGRIPSLMAPSSPGPDPPDQASLGSPLAIPPGPFKPIPHSCTSPELSAPVFPVMATADPQSPICSGLARQGVVPTTSEQFPVPGIQAWNQDLMAITAKAMFQPQKNPDSSSVKGE